MTKKWQENATTVTAPIPSPTMCSTITLVPFHLNSKHLLTFEHLPFMFVNFWHKSSSFSGHFFGWTSFEFNIYSLSYFWAVSPQTWSFFCWLFLYFKPLLTKLHLSPICGLVFIADYLIRLTYSIHKYNTIQITGKYSLLCFICKYWLNVCNLTRFICSGLFLRCSRFANSVIYSICRVLLFSRIFFVI